MVFVDLTNRCNMNCPICIANIPAMGFTFHPPIEYFEKVSGGIAWMQPVPSDRELEGRGVRDRRPHLHRRGRADH
jgi:uncharacterized radical SAM superfamily Fe-S cluster-containing enzyme